MQNQFSDQINKIASLLNEIGIDLPHMDNEDVAAFLLLNGIRIQCAPSLSFHEFNSLDEKDWCNVFEASSYVDAERETAKNTELLVNHVTLVRERLAEGEHWSDHFWVDANKTPSVELFKAVVQEYLRTPDGRKDIKDSCYDFNWGDAIMFVPLALWESHGIYDADGSYLPKEKGLVPNPNSNGFTFVVDQDEILIPDDYSDRLDTPEEEKPSLKDQIQSAATRVSDSHPTDKSLAEETIPER